MMNPLPAIIPLNEVKQPEPLRPLKDKKQYIMCITRDLSKEDKELFAKLDVVEYDDKIHKNLPINSFDFDVLIMDLREQGDRYCFMKEVAPHSEKYFIVVYCHAFEKDEYVNCDNQLFKLPEKQATPAAWLDLLLIKRISKPRWWVSLFKCILSSYHELKN